MSFFAYLCVQNPGDRDKESVQQLLREFGLVFRMVNLSQEFGAQELYGLAPDIDLLELEFVDQDVELLLLGDANISVSKEIPLFRILTKLQEQVAARPIVFNLDPDFELRLGRFSEFRGMPQITSGLRQVLGLGDLNQCVRLVIE